MHTFVLEQNRPNLTLYISLNKKLKVLLMFNITLFCIQFMRTRSCYPASTWAHESPETTGKLMWCRLERKECLNVWRSTLAIWHKQTRVCINRRNNRWQLSDMNITYPHNATIIRHSGTRSTSYPDKGQWLPAWQRWCLYLHIKLNGEVISSGCGHSTILLC